jgi:hypothetical protein
MTDALNKETFRERLIHRLDLAVPARQSFLLAILDLDDFKGINNRHGHVAGDEVLRAFAQGARKTIRREDDFGRIGGDEFAFASRPFGRGRGVFRPLAPQAPVIGSGRHASSGDVQHGRAAHLARYPA